ncbi:MAG: CSLREA domain-containing protein, partial [Anaerolineales bacterium]|nr:CSLREA domain-containing protein [Anaerolineales bacterium]
MKTTTKVYCAFILAALLFSALSAQPTRAAAIWTVNSTADSWDGVCDAADCTLREAVNLSATGDTIDFNLTYPNTITLGGAITVADEVVVDGEITLAPKAISINGPGADKLTVSGNNVTRHFVIPSGSAASISGVTFSNGNGGGNSAGNGGAFYNMGDLALDQVVVAANASMSGAYSGGGIYVGSHGTLTVNNSVFSG